MKKLFSFAIAAAFAGAMSLSSCSCSSEEKVDSVDDINTTEETAADEEQAEPSPAEKLVKLINETTVEVNECATAADLEKIVAGYVDQRNALVEENGGLEWAKISELNNIEPARRMLASAVEAKAAEFGVAAPAVPAESVTSAVSAADEAEVDAQELAAEEEVAEQAEEVLDAPEAAPEAETPAQ